MQTKSIIGLGEALWDLLPEGRKPGGAPANFAYHCAQFGLPAVAISALGNDALGDETVAQLEARELRYVMPRVDYPTGTVGVQLDEVGVPTYEIYEDVAWDHIPFNDEMRRLAENCGAVCWGSLAQRHADSRATIEKFLDHTPADCLRIFDINLRQHYYTLSCIENSLHRCNILKINDDELIILRQLLRYSDEGDETAFVVHLIHTYDLQMVVLTCGAIGSHVFSTDGLHSFIPTPVVDVVDTVGAGDSFTATFCAALLHGKLIREAHVLAVRVSAYVCTCPGAMPSLPRELVAEVTC